MDFIRMGWLYRTISYMGPQRGAAVRALAQHSPSGLMARVLRTSIVLLFQFRAATELIRTLEWFCRAKTFMGRLVKEAIRARARYSSSTPMARTIRTFIVLPALTTELIQLPD